MTIDFKTILGYVELASITNESLALDVPADTDPTGAAPEFQLVTKGTQVPTGSWVAGSWLTAYDADTKTAVALTPLLGSTVALVSGTDYELWIRCTIGAAQPAWKVGTIPVA